ncbi:MAG: Bug family tripartite tricarboxylate transporter substrate binding protein [Xanthobacteraceae bacterium]
MRRQRLWPIFALFAVAACGLGIIAANAQSYPSRSITFIVPNLPGGSSDLIARAVGAQLQQSLGQPVVIDNKPGASEMLATEALSRATADGYTIAVLSNALSINETLSPGRKYDAQRDLIGVAQLAELPFALIVSADLPVRSLQEFVAYAKAHPGELSYGHVGVGAPHYLTMEWFKRVAGLDILAVPYRSSAPVYTALLAGQIQVTVGALGGATQFIESGKVRALASMSKRRPISQPNLPTVSEAGYPEFDLVPWMGVFAPVHTPVDTVRKLEREILDAAQSPNVRDQLQHSGLEASALGTSEFGGRVKHDIARWAEVIRALGVSLQP